MSFLNIKTSISSAKEGGDATVSPSAQEKKGLFVAAFYTLLAGFIALPLFFTPFSGFSIELSKILFLGGIVTVAFFLWIAAQLKEGIFSIPKSLLLAGGFLVVLVFALSALLSPAIGVSLGGLSFELGTFASLFILFLTMFLASVLFESRGKIWSFLLLLPLSFGILLFFLLLRFLFGADFLAFGIFNDLTSLPIGKWNDFAIFSGLIAILSLAMLGLLSLAKFARILLYVLLGVSILVLASANFFLSWLVIGIFSIVFVVYNIVFREKVAGMKSGTGSRFSLPPFILLFISLLFVIGGDSFGRSISNVTGLSSIEVRPSWNSTMQVIKDSWAEDPALGSGPNRFASVWLAHKPDGINESIFWNTNFQSGIGLLPTFAVTTGMAGILSWLIFLLVFAYQGGRAFLASPNSLSHFFVFSSFSLALYLWIITIFYTPGVFVTGLAFFFTGIFIASLRQQGIVKDYVFSYIKDPRIGFVAVLASIFFLIGAVSGGYELFKRSLSLSYFGKSLVAFRSANDVGGAREKILKAILLNKTDTSLRTLSEIETARLAALVNQADVSPEILRAQFQEFLGSAVDAGREAVQIDETNYENWIALGRVYLAVIPLQIPGAYENARASFEAAQARNPKSPAIFLELARLEAVRGNMAGAREFTAQAISLKNNYTDALFLLAQINISEGKVKEAIDSVETASSIDPNNVGLFFQLGLLKYDQKDYSGAVSALGRAVELSPDYANAKYFLGISYYRIGMNSEAIRQFEDIKGLNPDNKEVDLILNNLRNKRDPFADVSSLSKPGNLKDLPIDEE